MKVIIKEKIKKFEDYEETNVINANTEFIEIDFENKLVKIQGKESSHTICNFQKGNIKIWSK